MKFRWDHPSPDQKLASQLEKDFQISPLLAQCLINRGIAEPEGIEDFLRPRLKKLSDPFLLPQMLIAIERLLKARELGECMVIYGDYDADGVTSTALLMEVLGALGWKVSCFIPQRLDEGYGLSKYGVGKCLEEHEASLILAVDCGSSSGEVIRDLKKVGIDVIVVDHHQIEGNPDSAVAVINPQINGSDNTEFQELCSVGLAFKLAHALVRKCRADGLVFADCYDLKPLLDLVALGTIADLVPLIRENRILVKAGLHRLNMTQRPGLVALFEQAQIKGEIGIYQVGFKLGPRLNAAGRLTDARTAVELLLSEDMENAMDIARILEDKNRERQQIEREIVIKVEERVSAGFNPETDYVIVEGNHDWHIGVVGIVASRIMKKFCRPTIIIGGEGAEKIQWRGSGRSIEGFDLAAAMRECEGLLISHGGHAMAAGMTIAPKKLDLFRTQLDNLCRQQIGKDPPKPRLKLDAEVSLTDLSLESLAE
ncbi:MAG TPA: single-stranded-DNA-specific exonuclease RecJ, partial [Verrucomicrobia bacterium]|nr:single-stranded-DNA-specific exonuclease RecJ [Verrucomicrobiota bacterium]